MPPLMVIYRGKRKLNIQQSSGILVETQKKACMDQHFMKIYLDKIQRPYTKEAADNLGLAKGSYLVLDSFSAHKIN